ncbi:MAG: TonB family protein [Deferribacterales bacterium]
MRKAAVQSVAIHGLLLGALFYASTITGLVPEPETQVIDLSAYFKETAPPPPVQEVLPPAPEPVQQQKTEAPAPVVPKPVQKQIAKPKPVENKVFESVNSAAVAEAAIPAAPPAQEPAAPAPAVQTAAATAVPVSAPVSAPVAQAAAKPSFDYSAYQSTLSSRLEKNKTYPMMARRRGMEGIVKMKLVISPSGALLNSEIVSSSGYDILDSEAMKLVRSVFPIKHNADKQISVVVPVMYKLQG